MASSRLNPYPGTRVSAPFRRGIPGKFDLRQLVRVARDCMKRIFMFMKVPRYPLVQRERRFNLAREKHFSDKRSENIK